MKIAVATNYSEGYRELAEITMPGKQEYCERHGYDFRPFYHPQNPERIARGEVTMQSPPDPHYDAGGFVRYKDLSSILHEYDIIFWTDSDALIMNHTKKIEDFFLDQLGNLDGTNIVVTTDCNRLNDGNFMVRNTNIMQQLFWQLARNGGAQHEYQRHPCGWGEPYGCQAVLRNYLYTEPYNHGVKWVPQRELDANLNTHYGFPSFVQGNFEPGDFVLHLPGMSWEDRIRFASKYAGEVVR